MPLLEVDKQNDASPGLDMIEPGDLFNPVICPFDQNIRTNRIYQPHRCIFSKQHHEIDCGQRGDDRGTCRLALEGT